MHTAADCCGKPSPDSVTELFERFSGSGVLANLSLYCVYAYMTRGELELSRLDAARLPSQRLDCEFVFGKGKNEDEPQQMLDAFLVLLTCEASISL